MQAIVQRIAQNCTRTARGAFAHGCNPPSWPDGPWGCRQCAIVAGSNSQYQFACAKATAVALCALAVKSADKLAIGNKGDFGPRTSDYGQRTTNHCPRKQIGTRTMSMKTRIAVAALCVAMVPSLSKAAGPLNGIPDDVRVGPLLTTHWAQGSAGSAYCYNYYTPQHHVCGCTPIRRPCGWSQSRSARSRPSC